ncbi:MAG: flagellar biosynthetic protein FliO [Pseudomonadota bacterium]
MDYGDYLKFLFALIFVLALMGLLAFGLKKLGLDRSGVMTGRKKRLKLLEIQAIDTKNKIALVQRDDRQHLILIGQNSSDVIESNIEQPDDEKEADKK